ncbi:MAG: hypothetical protein KIS92_12655 [Planctomycetota bacterium]|nr:hypothetical protein [Planctomycetota bacterium]
MMPRILAHAALIALVIAIGLALYARKLSKQSWIREDACLEAIEHVEQSTYAFPLSKKTLTRQVGNPAYSLFENHTQLLELNPGKGQPLPAGYFYVSNAKVRFAPTDSSDPRTNGNRYTLRYRGVRESARLSKVAKAAWGGTALCVCLTLAALFAQRKAKAGHLRSYAINCVHRAIECTKFLFESVRTSDPVIPIFFLIPIIFALLSSQNMYFDSPGYVDSYIYTAYFSHYTEHLLLLEVYYKVSRLPWILPGYLAYKIAGPIAGTYLLHMTVHAVGGAFCYLAIRDSLHSRRIAAVVAIFYSCCTTLLGPGGWNYHANITLLYYAASIWCLTKARQAQAPSKVWHFWSGVFIASAIHTHLAMAGLLPLQLLHFLASTKEKPRRIVVQFFHILLGGIVVTFALSTVNLMTGGSFLFFMNQINYTLNLAREGNHWHSPVDSWIGGAFWLVPIALSSVCSLFLLLKVPFSSMDEQKKRMLISCAVCNLGCLVYQEYLQIWKHHNVLQLDYTAVVVYFHVFHAMAAFLDAFDVKKPGAHASKFGERVQFALMACTVMAPLLAISDGTREYAIRLFPTPTEYLSGAVQASFIMGLLALVAAPVCLGKRWNLWIVVVFWSASNFFCKPVSDYNFSNRHAYYRDMYACFKITEWECAEYSPTLLEVKFWLDPHEVKELDGHMMPLGQAFNSMVATRGWLGNLLGASPGLPISKITELHIVDQKYLAILSSMENRDARKAEFMARLNTIGWSCEPVRIRDIRHGKVEYSLVIFEIQKCME